MRSIKLSFLSLMLAGVLIIGALPLVWAAATQVVFSGEVTRGETFEKKFDGMIFQLAPAPNGFKISVIDPLKGADKRDLSWFTPPLHGLTARDIEASDFRNKDNTGPNQGSVNRPQQVRKFLFSKDAPELMTRYWQGRGRGKDVEPWTKPRGEGVLRITKMQLLNLGKGKSPAIEKMTFTVQLKTEP